MLKTNKEKLVKMSVQGEAHHPSGSEIRVDSKGNSFVIPAIGGITYNIKIGDSAFDLVGDHVEPGVSMQNPDKNSNNAFMVFSCLGNKARVVSGEAKGAEGYVTGKHGGIEHVIAYFDDDTLAKMSIDDKILVEAYGQGLQLLDYPDIKVQSIDPGILDVIPIEEKKGKLVVPVAAVIPAYLMGSGMGSGNAYTGDYDVMTSDREEIKKLGIDKLRFGDLVLIEDNDNTFGRGYLRGARAIGVVIHSDCIVNGHGPGITTILASQKPILEAKLDENANLKQYYEQAYGKKPRVTRVKKAK